MSSEIEVTRGDHNGIKIPGLLVKNRLEVDPEEQLILNKLESGTEKEKKLIKFLYEYREEMNTDADHGDAGNKMQLSLFNTYLGIITNTDSGEFRGLWSILLLFAKLNKSTVFRSDRINRYTYLWNTGEDKMRCFQFLNNIVLLTLDPATRARNVRYQIDFVKSLDKYFSNEDSQKLQSFYRG